MLFDRFLEDTQFIEQFVHNRSVIAIAIDLWEFGILLNAFV
jgi:hypothetical protein